jgi:hypothetical protein
MSAEQLELTPTKGTAEEIARRIKDAIQGIIPQLEAERDRQYEREIAPLNEEFKQLSLEAADIAEAEDRLKELLPAKARECQREADGLLLAGKPEEAREVLAEMQEAENTPAAMATRMRELEERAGDEIPREKRRIARRAFYEWRDKLEIVIRTVEHGLFIDLLNGVHSSSDEFQVRTGLKDRTGDFFGITSFDTAEEAREHDRRPTLTAPEDSEEWKSGHDWYGGSSRR